MNSIEIKKEILCLLAEKGIDFNIIKEETIRRKLWDSDAEKIIFESLHTIINTDDFLIFPHMSVSAVFKDFGKYEDFKKIYVRFSDEKWLDNHFELTHFDFVIYNKSDYFPVLIIEADGAHHKTRPAVIHFDKFKNHLAEKNDIPLIRLELHNPDMDIEAELLKKLKAKNLNDPYNYPIYCWKCGKKFLYQPKGPYGSFYYCSCSKEENGKNITVSNNIKNCPPLFVWDKNDSK